ncbi:MAG: hypothetical protein V1733_00085 [bacterium]
MALKGKHNVAEIEDTRCSVVENGIPEARKTFLADLLTYNRYIVKAEHVKDKDGNILDTYVLGVTDILFNPAIVLYQHKLFRKDGIEVTPAYWEQKSAETEIPYWQVQP